MQHRILIAALWVSALALGSAHAAAPLASPAMGAAPIPAVALSYNGQRLAWIATRGGKAEPMLASWKGTNAHAIAITDACPATGLRWAPRWNTLAVMTQCGANGRDASAAHGSIWIVDVHGGAAPRKIANFNGYASGMQWKNTGKDIAFLYRPAAGPGSDSQVVAAVGANGGPFQILTPAHWTVHAFRLARIGDGMAFTATSTASQHVPVLYAMGKDGPRVVFDPNTATGLEHDLRIGLLRFPAYLIGFLARSPGANADDLYTIAPSGGELVNRTATNKIKPAWFTMNRHQVIATRVVDGRVQLIKYRMGISWLRQDRLWFTVDAPIGDGRAPYGVSISYFEGWRRVAFAQHLPGRAPVVRAGLLATQPPPIVASAGTEVASTAP